jgi:CBS domain-containing protein
MAERYVDQLMSRPVETVPPDATVGEAAEELITNDVGAVVVSSDGSRLEGLLTATDFVQCVRDGSWSSETVVADVMQTDVLTTTPGTPVGEVAAVMIDHLIHHVPVVDGREVVGIITTLDVTGHVASSFES